MTLAAETVKAKRRRRAVPATPSPAADTLLAWYDRERRDLPWRAAPGERADPYRVWLSEIMLQQTRVETVVRYYERFLERFPTVEALARARLDSVLKLWAGLGYYARARNLHACAREVTRCGGFPADEAALRELPGVGAYTAAAIAAIAFGRKASPVDGNIERVVARLFAVATPMPEAKPELRRIAATLVPETRAGDFAQAMMDLGATICTPRRPDCPRCPWSDACTAYRQGDPEAYPRRTPKTEGKLRRGAAFVVVREDGAVLLRRRAPNGLLGGMSEVPTTDWSAAPISRAEALREVRRVVPLPVLNRKGANAWHRRTSTVRHVFSHFALELDVYVASVPERTAAPRGCRFAARTALDGEALPSLMQKVIAHALRNGGQNSRSTRR